MMPRPRIVRLVNRVIGVLILIAVACGVFSFGANLYLMAQPPSNEKTSGSSDGYNVLWNSYFQVAAALLSLYAINWEALGSSVDISWWKGTPAFCTLLFILTFAFTVASAGPYLDVWSANDVKEGTVLSFMANMFSLAAAVLLAWEVRRKAATRLEKSHKETDSSLC